jgi:hypothetical protein
MGGPLSGCDGGCDTPGPSSRFLDSSVKRPQEVVARFSLMQWRLICPIVSFPSTTFNASMIAGTSVRPGVRSEEGAGDKRAKAA